MTGKHWALIGLFIGGLATSISGLHSWAEVTAPSFVAGVLMQASAAIVALYSEKPGTPA